MGIEHIGCRFPEQNRGIGNENFLSFFERNFPENNGGFGSPQTFKQDFIGGKNGLCGNFKRIEQTDKQQETQTDDGSDFFV